MTSKPIKPQRQRTGSVYTKNGRLYLAVRTHREDALHAKWATPCQPKPDGTARSEDEARQIVAKLQAAYDCGAWDPWDRKRAQLAAAPTGETLASYVKRWCDDREARGNRSVRDDRSRLAHYLLPGHGHKLVTEIARDDIEGIRDRLDALIAEEGGIAWKTAANIWATITKLCADMVFGALKNKSLGVRADNPAVGILPPERGEPRSKTCLYPSEFDAAMRSDELPLEFRQLVAVATYEYLREGELYALHCDDIDIAHLDIHIWRTRDAKTGAIRELTKTSAGRRHVPIEPALVPLLTHLVKARAGGLLFPVPMGRGDAASLLRTCLEWVGVTRAAIFASDDSRKRLTFHDLRGTGITWRCVRGDNHVAIKTQAGHESFETTLGYVAVADALRSGFGVPFPALPASLWVRSVGDGTDPGPDENGYRAATETRTSGFPAAIECPRRDSNPESTRLDASRGDFSQQFCGTHEHAATCDDIPRHPIGYPVAGLSHSSELSQLEALEHLRREYDA
jgi:integrase